MQRVLDILVKNIAAILCVALAACVATIVILNVNLRRAEAATDKKSKEIQAVVQERDRLQTQVQALQDALQTERSRGAAVSPASSSATSRSTTRGLVVPDAQASTTLPAGTGEAGEAPSIDQPELEEEAESRDDSTADGF